MSKSPTKLKNSKTTGLLPVAQTQSNGTGLQPGETGSSWLQSVPVDRAQGAVATPRNALQCKEWLLALSRPPLKALSAIDEKEANEVIEWLRKPSPRDWLSARIVTLLSHYFISQTDERVAKAAAKDWIEILRVVPPWAVSNACRKYLAGDERRRKPMPGDILDLAKKEMWFVTSAANSLLERERLAQIKPPREIDPEMRKRVGEGMKQLAASMSAKNYGLKPISKAEHQRRINEAKDQMAEMEAIQDQDRDYEGPSDALMESALVKKAKSDVDNDD